MSFILVVPVLLGLISCKNDLQLNAPYKEIPSVYAVLNPFEPIQVIRVNKVFLGEGDANVMAKVADSINYQPGELLINLRRFVDGTQVSASPQNTSDTVITFRDSMVTATPGAFNTNQRVYVSSKKLFTDGVYKLTIRNVISGAVFTSTASALDRVYADLQPLVAPFFEYPQNTPPELYIDYSSTTSKYPYEVKHRAEKRFGQIYQLILRMHLYDTVGGQRTEQAVDYLVGTKTLRDVQVLSGINYVSHTFTGGGIFSVVGNAVSKMNQNIYGRKMYMVEYFIYSSSQEYQDYMEYVKPSLSITQNKPLYSNFQNAAALGLFTFRTTLNVKKNLASVYISSFSNNPSTCNYRFVTSDGKTIRGCK
ncbi:MAG: hypothetical protein PSX36_04910 [bacterium]|nr:hypothetical protein [bacterium]